MATGSTTKGVPAQAQISNKKQELAGTPTLMFPSDLGEFFMSFEFYDYRTLGQLQKQSTSATKNVEITRNIYNANKDNVQNAIKNSKDAFARISLPIPANLVDHFRVEYQTTSLGLPAGIAGEIGQGFNDLSDGIFTPQQKQLLSDVQNTTSGNTDSQGFLSQLRDNTGAQLTARVGLMGAADWIQDLYDLSSGVATNPNLAVLFKGPTLKQHTFSWKFAPRSQKESESIRKIIAILKRAMHPRKLNNSTSALLKYPSECLAQFHGPKENFLYPLRPTVVEDVVVNYAPNGTLSTFQETHDTTAYEITIMLQETSYNTRESFGDVNEYGYDGFANGPGEEINKGLTR